MFAILGLWLLLAAPAWAGRILTLGAEVNDAVGASTEMNMWNSGTSIVTTPVYSGTYAVRAQRPTPGSAQFRRNLAAADTAGTYCTRFRLRRASTPSADSIVHQVLSSGSVAAWHATVSTANVLTLVNDNDSSSITGPTLTVDTWYRVESCVLLGDGTGTLELKLDGTSQGTLSSKDTLPTDVTYFYFGIYNAVTTADFYFDDIAINDETGSFQTSWPGDGKIAYVEPASDVANAWEDETSGASTYANINELPGTPDDATSYNGEAVTLNSVDRFGISTLPAEIPANATMILMDLNARYGGTQTGAARARYKIWNEGGTLTDGPDFNCTVNGWRIATSAEHQVYDLTGKTKANVEAFNVGYENHTDLATRDRRVTALWANVEWIEAPTGGRTKISGATKLSGATKIQ
jgi:hypothetical protein